MDTKFRQAAEAFIERAGLTPAIVNGAKNSKVDGQIEAWQTALPLRVEPGASQILDLYFQLRRRRSRFESNTGARRGGKP